MRRALGWGQYSMVSKDFLIILSLSLSSGHYGPKPEINKPIRI